MTFSFNYSAILKNTKNISKVFEKQTTFFLTIKKKHLNNRLQIDEGNYDQLANFSFL